MKPWAAPVVAGLCVLLVTGCGRDRREPRVQDPAAAVSSKTVRADRAGIRLALPANMVVRRPATGTTVIKATLGDAFVAVFAYRRREQLPRTPAELEAARKRLGSAVEPESSRVTELAGAPAVELLVGQPARSLHVYKGSVEYVVQIGAPRAGFERFDDRVTPLVRRTLRVSGRIRGS